MEATVRPRSAAEPSRHAAGAPAASVEAPARLEAAPAAEPIAPMPSLASLDVQVLV